MEQDTAHEARPPPEDVALLARVFLPTRVPPAPAPDGQGGNGTQPDCAADPNLWDQVGAAMLALPAPALSMVTHLIGKTRGGAFAAFLRRARGSAMSRPGHAGRQHLSALFNELDFPAGRDAAPDATEWDPLDAAETADLLGPGGPFASRLTGYEFREGQAAMTRAVAEALNQRRHLMVEAGTGIGKSLAYLVPAVLWSTRNGTPVVLSTNTKNLQSQLFEKDIPLVRRMLDVEFKAALIKGRLNYLCVRKLLHLLRHRDVEIAAEERVAVAGIMVWSIATRTGDLSEYAAWETAARHGLGVKVTCTGEECLGPSCTQRNACFLRAARARSRAADVIVANHALVFAEMNMVSPALPPYTHVVFDEAHNLEDAATRHFSVEISPRRIRVVLRRLWRPRRRQGGTGLVPALMRQMEAGTLGEDAGLRKEGPARGRDIIDAVESAETVAGFFFEALADLVTGGETRRLDPERRPAAWPAVLDAKACLVRALAALIRATETLVQALGEIRADALPFQMEFTHDLEAAVLALKEIIHDVEFVLAADSAEFVFWVEPATSREGSVRAWAAPIRIGDRLADELYAAKDTVIFSSATLSVRNSFTFLKSRLGIDRIDAERIVECNVGTPFDYPRQCVVMVPMFLPEPGAPGDSYAGELGCLLAEVFARTRGRGMALFTSYDMLRRTTDVLRRQAQGQGLQVLAQGVSGSREHITEAFAHDLESVLMGTHSFWEGVDLVGETLSCLVVARLPFAVFTDPVVEARCEQIRAEGADPFIRFSLPAAVIRFRQGFGRLIRHRSDRGVVIVTDRRMMTKRYGTWFRTSLPAPTRTFPEREALLDAIEEFLAET